MLNLDDGYAYKCGGGHSEDYEAVPISCRYAKIESAAVNRTIPAKKNIKA